MEKNLNKSIMKNSNDNKLSSVEKRKLTIQKKALNKQLKKEQYALKLGLEKINEIKAKIKETKKRNFEKTLFIPNQRVEIVEKQRKYEKKALGGTFKEITLVDEEFTLIFIEHGIEIRTSNRDKIIISISNTVVREFINKPDNINLFFNVQIKFTVYQKIDIKGQIHKEYSELFFNTKTATILHSLNQIKEWSELSYLEFAEYLQQTILSSSVYFYEINYIRVQISKRTKTRGGSYVDLPDILKNKKAIINIKNKDDECIIYALLAFKYYDTLKTKEGKDVKDKNELYHYKKYYDEIKQPKDITYPIDVQKDIKKFEKLNKIKINVFSYDKEDTNFKTIKPLYNNMDRNNNVVNLLLYNNHLMYIKDIGKLLRRNHNEDKIHHCYQCLSKSFSTKEKLEIHLDDCMKNEAVRAVLPRKFDTTKEFYINKKGESVPNDPNKREDILKFRNLNHTFKHPFHCFLDFESTLENVEDGLTDKQRDNEITKDKDNKKVRSSNVYQKHIANSVGIKFNCIHEEYSKDLFIYNNKDPELVLKNTIEYLEEQAINAFKLTQLNRFKIDMSPLDEINYKESTVCLYCNTKYDDDNVKVKHHDHITGKFINPCCNNCNLKFKIKKFIPVYCHNLKNYDSHFLITALNKYGYINLENNDDFNITAIPNNEEKYISFSKMIKVGEDRFGKPLKYEIRFLDSLAFMASSLSTLAENLNSFKGDEINNIIELRKIYKNTSEYFKDDEHFLLMIKKGIYPYDYIDNYERLNENKLPTKDKFFSKLTNQKCKDEDYKTAEKVWEKFNCQSMLDYHNIYLATDVLLLADIWNTFKDTCYRIYNLDATYYYTAPSLSWDAFLYHTTQEYKKDKKNFEIELITDMDMYLMWEKSIRGGLSQISKRYAKGNNKYMKNYDPSKIDETILYTDANNLYAFGMSSFLPTGNFSWNEDLWNYIYNNKLKMNVLNDEGVEKIMNIGDEGKIGYLFEVDLHYPKELHDHHNGYALASENKVIKREWLSEWQSENYKENKIKKLITNFHDKIKYCVNYRILKLFLSLGLVITKVHRIIQYEQDDYMKSYIMKNTNERTKAKNEFEKDFYKLMNNSVYGKTLENVRNRINFKLLSTVEKALALRNEYKKFTTFTDSLVGIHLCKREVILNKPIFIGSVVLDESKLLMYRFHYNFMLKNFKRENIDLLFTDTDSLCYHIKNEDPYKIMYENKEHFDLANYPKEHFLFDKTNNKVIGKMKNEEASTQIIEFAGTQPKSYSYLTDNDKSIIKAKGVKQNITKNKNRTVNEEYLSFQDEYDCVINHKNKNIKQNTIRSVEHKLYSISTVKAGLNFADDKVYICDDYINCLTLGHYKIEEENLIKRNQIISS